MKKILIALAKAYDALEEADFTSLTRFTVRVIASIIAAIGYAYGDAWAGSIAASLSMVL